MASEPGDVTSLLRRLQAGDRSAGESLLELVYHELRRLASACMRPERIDHTLQPTALVHEAWLRLIDQREWNLENRTHFFRIAAQVMRRILIDYARAANAEKRGGAYHVVSLDNAIVVAVEHPAELLDVHRALERLEKLDPRRAELAEMRFFAGLSIDEIAELTGVTARTVDRQWRAARAWLGRELTVGSQAADGV
jgi:RNA polymerase sigma-70 factor, ECF subfamily